MEAIKELNASKENDLHRVFLGLILCVRIMNTHAL